jgi:hypothetical protein
MGPGHFSIAFAAKTVAPKAPLWTLLVASEALDLLCFGLVAMGIESLGVNRIDISQGVTMLEPRSLPWSHGLFMSVVWSAVAAAIAYLVFHDRRAGAALGLVVFSHWALDFIVHTPDLPLLFDGSPVVGLNMWGSGAGLVLSGILEIALLVGGVAIYITYRNRK